jgi:hypothetical protein
MGQTSSGRGLTVTALLFIIAALGLAVAALLPIYKHAVDMAALRSTMADMQVWAKAIEAYAEDHGAAPPNPNGELTFKKPIVTALQPYLDRLRTADWWGSRYLIWTGPGVEEAGLTLTSPREAVILSRGKGGQRELWRYDPSSPDAGLYEIRGPEDFANDLILWNGRPVRWPKDRS